jgi:CubicO group peptidase (beta-lactamase class C family)/glyoxylase-like metal-dependent hydrolase (beta-lactamase superfamily II)
MCGIAPFALAVSIAAVGQVDWFQSFPAHCVVGNVYYVGSKDLASYLITTPEGHILINSGFERTVPLITKSVESLGFKMTDIKILLASHAHSDHVAGHALMQKQTGAKVYVMRGDDGVIASGGEGQYLYTVNRWKPCKVDRVLEDGDEVKLGDVTLVARLTPGHTRGCTTWTWRASSGGKTYDVVVIGSPNVNPGYQLVDNKWYPDIADDFARTFYLLKKLPCDVFLGAHGGYYGMVEKFERARKDTQTNPFVDPEGYNAFVADKEKAFRDKLAAQRPSPGRDRPAALSAISERLRTFFDSHEIAGVTTLVATRDGIVYLDSIGKADIAHDKPMQSDSIFWIASMTKPITGTAVLMLQDEGKLSIDDPVEKHLPEFKDLKTTDGKPARLTIRHLLTHTSGMAEVAPGQAREITTLAGLIPLHVAKPLAFEPGTKWVYCQSGINTAARIVEVVSGQPFDQFLDKRLFVPLGMRDTTFYLTEAQLPRLATPYRRTSQGALEETQNFILYGKSPTSRDRFPAANGGLFSTARDYYRFCQIFINNGELDGRRYLKPETVKLMTRIQTGAIKTGFTEGNGWGLGFCIVRDPQGVTSMLSPGSFGHGGAFGTQAWIDPEKKRIFILLVQRADFPNSDASEVRRAFQQAAAFALDKPK